MKQPVTGNQNRAARPRAATRRANRLVGRGAYCAADLCGVFSMEPAPSDTILLEMPTALAAYVCRQLLREA